MSARVGRAAGTAGLRLGLVADTHIPEARGQLWPQVFDAFAGCDAILHAGDIHELWLLDQLQEVAPVFAARGNGDEGFGGRVRAQPDARVHDTWILDLTKRACGPGSLRLGMIHDLTIPEVPPYLTVDNVTGAASARSRARRRRCAWSSTGTRTSSGWT